MKKAAIYIGTSGWYYDHWEDVLYPGGLAKSKRFGIYSLEFNSVEINATYSRLPTASMVEGWYAKAPRGFIYTVKAPKEITHNRKLKDTTEPLSRFLRILTPMKDKLGAILYQLPPSLKKNSSLLQDFLKLLPSQPKACFEFRHPSWECDATYEILNQSGAGHVVVSKNDYLFVEEHTAGIAYYRLHGPEQLCASSYSNLWLRTLGEKIILLSDSGISCFAFFNNDIGGHAVHNARTLQTFLTNYFKPENCR